MADFVRKSAPSGFLLIISLYYRRGLFTMFCQQCGAEASEESKYCQQCGHNFKTGFQISNKAMALAALAAIVSVGTTFLPFASKSETKAQDGKVEKTAATTTLSSVATLSPEPKP